MANEYQECTSLRLTSSDLHTIRRVLYSYTNELRRNAPQLPTTDEQIKTIEAICERITVGTLPRGSKTPDDFDLSPDELTLVDSALKAYIVSIGRSIPPSEERDEIMRGCEALRIQIMAACTPPGSLPEAPTAS